jgi:ubiquinone/menaquinone biosynthesis C-methylase UbiE
MQNNLYATRKLTEGHPQIEEGALAHFNAALETTGDSTARLDRWLTCLERLTCLTPPKRMIVLGCGARPVTLRHLLALGHDAVGVEPVPSFLNAARQFLGSTDRVIAGTAENIPVDDSSQDVIFCESVLEHVDSPRISVREMYRVAAPGAVALVHTTNRLRINLRGKTDEFTVPFYNWLPALVKESFVFEHLHYRPSLANYTPRPAVHWFTYTDLCRLGRDGGFAQFYGIPDVLDPNDAAIRHSALRRALFKPIQRSPWLRALAMTQLGHIIFMVKRRG